MIKFIQSSGSGTHADDQSGGFFTNASGSTFNQPSMFDMKNPHFYHTIVNNIMTGSVGATGQVPSFVFQLLQNLIR